MARPHRDSRFDNDVDLSDQFQRQWDDIIRFVSHVFYGTIVPVAAVLVFVAIVLQTGVWIRQQQRRRTPLEWHIDAIQQLTRNSTATARITTTTATTSLTRRTKDPVATAQKRLIRGMERFPEYDPISISLAALYIYALSKPMQAIIILESLQNSPPGARLSPSAKSDVELLLLDARAVLAGQGHMVQSILRQEDFLSIQYVVTANHKWQMLQSSSPSRGGNSKKTK